MVRWLFGTLWNEQVRVGSLNRCSDSGDNLGDKAMRNKMPVTRLPGEFSGVRLSLVLVARLWLGPTLSSSCKYGEHHSQRLLDDNEPVGR
jgi:hypothetical protein